MNWENPSNHNSYCLAQGGVYITLAYACRLLPAKTNQTPCLAGCSLETIIGKLPYSQETITDCLEDLHNEEKITYKLKGQSRYWYPENI